MSRRAAQALERAEAAWEAPGATDGRTLALAALEAERACYALEDGANEALWRDRRRRAAFKAGLCMECLSAPAAIRCGGSPDPTAGVALLEGCGGTWCTRCPRSCGCAIRWALVVTAAPPGS